MAPLEYDKLIVDIADYIHTPLSIAPKTWINARNALLDSIGCAIETLHQSKECRLIVGPVVSGTRVPNGFRLPGTAFELDPEKGAFDLGSAIRYLDRNDAYPGREWGHPSDSIGALLAVADWRSRLHLSNSEPSRSNEEGNPMTIRLLLTAIIKSYEIQGIYQERNAFNQYGLDHTLLTKLAATAALTGLMGMTHAQTCAAVSQVWTDSSPLRLFRQSPNTGPRKGWAAGDACMRAVHLALLTKQGQPGYPTALMDPEWGFLKWHYGNQPLITRPFSTSVIDGRFVKLVAAEGHGVSAVEAALTFSKRLKSMGIKNPAHSIAKIQIRTMKAAMTIIDKTGPLRNAADRDHCMRYMVALTLIKGDWPRAGDYEDGSRWAVNENIEVLRGKIEMREDEGFTADYHDRAKRTGASGVTITLRAGEEGAEGVVLEEVVVEYPVGHPWHEGTETALREKTVGCLRLGFREEEVEHIIATAEGEGWMEGSVCDFVDLFWKGTLGQQEDEKVVQDGREQKIVGIEGVMGHPGEEKEKHSGI
ncbi:2-methylcitrate dehydratase [Venturia nashicola]|nr:2-methylcitrate dehydratase [Venturia nashicola]